MLPHYISTLPLLSSSTLYSYGIVGKATWAHLSTSHHIKPEPLGDVNNEMNRSLGYFCAYTG